MHVKKAEYIISSPSYEKCPAPDKPEYAFIGRSNVGKSSLINMLCHNDKLAKTSNSPGKTQMINHFEITSVSRVGDYDETKCTILLLIIAQADFRFLEKFLFFRIFIM